MRPACSSIFPGVTLFLPVVHGLGHCFRTTSEAADTGALFQRNDVTACGGELYWWDCFFLRIEGGIYSRASMQGLSRWAGRNYWNEVRHMETGGVLEGPDVEWHDGD